MHLHAIISIALTILSLSTAEITLHSNSTLLERHVRATCSCGQRNNKGTKIVGGQNAEVNEFPWSVALFRVSLFRVAFSCTASLIDSSWVLTAAHCVEGRQPSQLLASIGDHDLKTPSETKHQIRKFSKIIVRPGYNKNTMDGDIALLKLDKPVVYSKNIGPVCLPFALKARTFAQDKVTAAGWGVTREGGSDAGRVLHKVDLNVLPNPQCSPMYPKLINANKICTMNSGRDACQGDSGGGLYYYDPGTKSHHCIGIVSFGQGCARANKAGVYTRVTNYLTWIQQQTAVKFCTP